MRTSYEIIISTEARSWKRHFCKVLSGFFFKIERWNTQGATRMTWIFISKSEATTPRTWQPPPPQYGIRLDRYWFLHHPHMMLLFGHRKQYSAWKRVFPVFSKKEKVLQLSTFLFLETPETPVSKIGKLQCFVFRWCNSTQMGKWGKHIIGDYHSKSGRKLGKSTQKKNQDYNFCPWYMK